MAEPIAPLAKPVFAGTINDAALMRWALNSLIIITLDIGVVHGASEM